VDGDAYGNWVSARFISGPALIALVFVLLAVTGHVVRIFWLVPVTAVAAVLAALVAVYFAYARHLLAANSGEVQARVQALVLDHLDWDGCAAVALVTSRGAAPGTGGHPATPTGEPGADPAGALDIGCGNGPLTIALAEKFPQVSVTGIDYWGESWEYSQDICEANAAACGVAGRTSFQRASAAALPFADGSFAAVVSNLCFHEVRDAHDKREVVREALRVLEPGGAFAFQDLFRLKSAYGTVDELLAAVRSWGVSSVDYADTGRSEFIPAALRLPFMVGTMGVLHGKK
jgi:SAM-dependent methyltransferase